MEISKTVFFT